MKGHIGVTLGDPAGIGPEIIEAALPRIRKRYPEIQFTVLGKVGSVRPGRPCKKSALQALEALQLSADGLKGGELQGVVTGPVSKTHLQQVGFHYPGQTEFYARTAGLRADAITMMMVAPTMSVALVSTHCSLKQAIRKLTVDRLQRTILQAHEMMLRMGREQPRLAVAGLNPHAGEDGAFGDEEIRLIRPVIRQIKRKRMKGVIAGPFSPDVVYRECSQGQWDVVIAPYHDQALVPFKLIAFDEGVNVTSGLPFIRTSPDHGTAFGIAGQGEASARSMEQALDLAACLLGGRGKKR
jgi:4-hydroxythreonine-4-phosphate dehydrogenase